MRDTNTQSSLLKIMSAFFTLKAGKTALSITDWQYFQENEGY
jgi:hypothetical protein